MIDFCNFINFSLSNFEQLIDLSSLTCKSIEDNAGTGGGAGLFVYSTSNSHYIAAGGGVNAGFNGVNGQYSNSGATSLCTNTGKHGSGGTGGTAGICCNVGNYHGGVRSGLETTGSPRQNGHSGGAGGSRAQSRTGIQAGEMYTGIQAGPSPVAVGGFGREGGNLKITVDMTVREDALEVVVGWKATEQAVVVDHFV